jgi:mRNA-degrading endonuclease RelE of RelBE toxin-antitoxin system
MPPDAFTAHSMPYGIVQTPFVHEALAHANSAAQWPLAEAIMKLQTDPRPDGHEPADDFGKGYTAIVVGTSPPFQIIYQVNEDEKRVLVIAVVEKRW